MSETALAPSANEATERQAQPSGRDSRGRFTAGNHDGHDNRCHAATESPSTDGRGGEEMRMDAPSTNGGGGAQANAVPPSTDGGNGHGGTIQPPSTIGGNGVL